MRKFLSLAILGVAMVYWEGITVVCLRRVLGISDSQSNEELPKKLSKND